jgi:8-oxo-dGTP pyrophosphatase MutT (NUDIX family)
MEKTEIYSYKPLFETEAPLVVAGGVLIHDDKFLLLKRHPEKPYGDHWNLPAGKVERHEAPQKGAQREIHEETGIFIPLENLAPLHVFYIKRGKLFIEFHIFKASFQDKPEINLKLDENIDAIWSSHEEAMTLPLLSGGAEILNFCINSVKQKP